MRAICHLQDENVGVTVLQRPDGTYYSHKVLPGGAVFRSKDFESIERAITGAKTPFRHKIDIVMYGRFQNMDVSISVRGVDPDNVYSLYPLVERLDSTGIDTDLF